MYKSLQSGRAIAAIFVVLFHLGGTLAKDSYFAIAAMAVPFSFGNSGVEFFFVLSGFIILTAHLMDIGQPSRITVYMRKRLLRIYPTYWVIFLPIFFIALIVPSTRFSVPHDWKTILQSLLLIPQNIATVGGTGSPVIVVAWTLQYEMLFYLFFAILIFNIRVAIFSGTAVLVCYVVGIFLGSNRLPFPFSFIAQDYLLLFGMGMLVASLVSSKKLLTWLFPLHCIAIGLAIFMLVALDVVIGADILESWRTLIYGLSASLIIFGLVTSEQSGKIYLSHKWLQLLGDASYALYLIHFPLISLLCKVAMAFHAPDFGLVGAVVTFVVILMICLVVSVLFHLWIERPITAFFHHPKAA